MIITSAYWGFDKIKCVVKCMTHLDP